MATIDPSAGDVTISGLDNSSVTVGGSIAGASMALHFTSAAPAGPDAAALTETRARLAVTPDDRTLPG